MDTTVIMSGIEFAKNKQDELVQKVVSGEKKLTVIQVGNDPASSVYINQKKKFGEAVGVEVNHWQLDDQITTEHLTQFVKNIKHPVIVQLPLPSHIESRTVLDSIDWNIDVDGFTTENMGRLMSGQHGLQPCTPKGIVQLLDYYNIAIEGKHTVIVGRSDIVGKPVAMMMLNRNATVTICHSKTKNLSSITSQADILIVAMGQPEFITAEHVKEGAVVVDAGIHRLEDNSIVGDVWFDDVVEKVSAITPVPKGVGRCTVAMLFENVLDYYLKK